MARRDPALVIASRSQIIVLPRGYTLMEVLLALSLSLALVSGVLSLSVGAQISTAALAARARAQENLQLAFALIERVVQHGGNFACAHPQRAQVSFLNGEWPQIPEYDLTRPVLGYEALGGGQFAPDPALTLPLSGAGGDQRVHKAGHGVDLGVIESNSDILVIRGSGPSVPLAAPVVGRESIAVPEHVADFVVDDVVLISDCEQAALVKITHVTDTANGQLLGWAAGPGVFDNTTVGRVHGAEATSDSLALLARGFASDASVAAVTSSIFYLAPSLVRSRQGQRVSALWLKSGADPSVEIIAGITDLQVWFLVAEDANPDARMGYFQAGQLTPDALVVGLRIMLRSSSVDELTEVGQRPVSTSASRTFMLPRFGRWGHAS